MTKNIGVKRLKNPWLSNSILKCIKTKHNLYKKVQSNIKKSWSLINDLIDSINKIFLKNYFK